MLTSTRAWRFASSNEVLRRLPFRLLVVQTDNGAEFQSRFHWHLEGLDIRHVYIRPRTPHLNGKVVRSHRVDDLRARILRSSDAVMTPDRWREVERLYHAALERAEGERGAFLAAACRADEELRREVESLLAQPESHLRVGDRAGLAAAAHPSSEAATPSMIGRRIRGYELVALLGVGGMGEVYRARDSRLGREVAIKILPSAFKADRDRIARFEREAQVLAALKHQHIGAIYGLEETDDFTALVMELVEGEDLSKRLRRGPIPLHDALTMARQIADALDAAHEQGIIHRDLKPANVRVQKDGTVKVLDFGLAKPLSPGDAITPTVTAISQPGEIIGTPAYMSPEQARGEAAGREADIWAFGVVLYETLTGVSPFACPTTTETLVRVLTASPDDNLLPLDASASVRRLIRRCLEKDPKRRLRHMGDVRNELDEALSAAPLEPTPGQVSISHPSGAFSARALAWMTTIAFAALALVAYSLVASRVEDSPQEVRLQMSPPSGMRFVSVPAVSPDGRQLVFAAAPESGGDARLWLRPLAAAAATELPGTVGGTYPFWSANGRSVAFFADGQMKRVAVAGGNPVIVCEASAGRGGLWLDDDTIVFAPMAFSPLMRVDASGGPAAPLTKLADDETGHRFPQRLPGRQLMYFSVNRTPEKSGTRLVTIDDPNRTISFVAAQGVAEYVKGVLIFARGRAGTYTVLGQRITLPDGQLTGEPVEIGRTRVSETFGRAATATGPTGVIVMLRPVESIGQFTWIARDGRVLETVGAPSAQLGVELSPDRQQVATFRSGEIWSMSLARPVPNRVTRGGVNRHPIWSPDGDNILSLYQGRGVATFDLVTTTITTDEVRMLQQATNMVKPMGWTRDDRLIWIESSPSGSSLWTIEGNGPPTTVFRESAQTAEARVSPDGRWIAYASNRSGRFEVEVSSFPRFGQRYPVSVEGGGYPRWRADGGELYFLSADGRLMAASFAAGPAPTIGTATPLFEVNLVAHPDRGSFAAYEYDVTADGSRFLINRLVSPPDASMSIIVDWNAAR